MRTWTRVELKMPITELVGELRSSSIIIIGGVPNKRIMVESGTGLTLSCRFILTYEMKARGVDSDLVVREGPEVRY